MRKSFIKICLFILLVLLLGCNDSSKKEEFKLTINKVGEGIVTESSDYEANTTVVINANPSEGYIFNGWYNQDKLLSSNNEYSFKMPKSDYIIEALFTKKDVEIKKYGLSIEENGNGIVTGEGTYDEDEMVNISATPNKDYCFDGWYQGDTLLSKEVNYSFKIDKNIALSAKFIPIVNNFKLLVYTNTTTKSIDSLDISCSIENPYKLKDPIYDLNIPNLKFMGWSTRKTLTESSRITEIKSSTTMIYAIYGLTVTFIDVDGSSYQEIIPYGTEITDISNDKPYNNYEFTHWSNDKLTSITEETTLYARYKMIEEINVDKDDFIIYEDDTTITYQIKTTTIVDKIDLFFFDMPDIYYSNINDYGRSINNIAKFCEDPKETKGILYLRTLTITKDNLSDDLINAPKESYEEIEGNTKYSAQRSESNGFYYWTIKWDLGNTAIKYIKIEVSSKETNSIEKQYLKMNVRYPSFDYEFGFESAIYKFIEKNLTEPILFNINLDSMSSNDKARYTAYNPVENNIFTDKQIMLLSIFSVENNRETLGNSTYYKNETISSLTDFEYYQGIMNRSVIYGGNFYEKIPLYPSITVTSMTFIDISIHPKAKNNIVLLNHYTEGKTYCFFTEITDEMRAVVAYQNNYTIDKDLFPIANDILEKAKPVIESIITDDMTEFEKEHAIYKWMIDKYNQGITPAPDSNQLYVKSAYGFLNGHGGDCMGWSGTFFTLCNMAGVKCKVVSAKAEAGGAKDSFNADHRFNIVMLDDEFYFVEVFWFYQKNNQADGDWRFFNMTTEKASKTHTWATSKYFGPPLCNYTKYQVNEITGERIR